MVSGELMTPHSHTNIHYKVGISMGHITAQDFIRKEVAVWGEDYVDDLLDRGYIPVELIVTFDATRPQPVPKNVMHLINFYQENGFGKRVSKAS